MKQITTTFLWVCLMLFAQVRLFSQSVEILYPQKPGETVLPVESIYSDRLGSTKPIIHIENVSTGAFKVTLRFDLNKEVRQKDCAVHIIPSFQPNYHWAPHLTPTGNHVIDQHVFRNPAMIVQDDEETLLIIPDTENIYLNEGYRIYMDLNATDNQLTLGMCKTKVTDHVLYEKDDEAVFPKGIIELSFYVISSKGDLSMHENPFRYVLNRFWQEKGHPAFLEANLSKKLFESYCNHAYEWAFKNWGSTVWQEFSLNGQEVGAPVFIVNTTQSPNYPGEVNEREMRSIWNQAWFSSLRSGTGLYRHARRTKNPELMKKARLMKELALASPQKDGLFYGVVATEMEALEINGKVYNRSKGWNTAYWGNSNRNPVTRDVRESPFHILDMSWTAYVMLQWYEELEQDQRLLNYSIRYADALLKLQDAKGYFPAWLDTKTGEILPELKESPETSMSSLFLLKLYELTKKRSIKQLDCAV